MAVRWPGAVLLALVLLWCCCAVSHGRVVPAGLDPPSLPSGGSVREIQRGGGELGTDDFDGIIVWMRRDGKSSFPSAGEIPTRVDDADSHRQSENHAVSVIQGQAWKRRLGTIAEWVFHACVVVLAVYAISYTVSCICACCISLDLLAEIWRILGGWLAFSYFVRVEQAVAETDPEPLPLLRSTAEP